MRYVNKQLKQWKKMAIFAKRSWEICEFRKLIFWEK